MANRQVQSESTRGSVAREESSQAVDLLPATIEVQDPVVTAEAILESPVRLPLERHTHTIANSPIENPQQQIAVPDVAVTVQPDLTTRGSVPHSSEPGSADAEAHAENVGRREVPPRPNVVSEHVFLADLAIAPVVAADDEAERQIIAHTDEAPTAHSSMDQLPVAGAGDQPPLAPQLSNAGTDAAPTVSEASVARQVSEAIAAWRNVAAEHGTARFAAWLTPPELGHVWIELTSSRHGVTARLAAADDSVQSLLEAQAPALRQSLTDAGVTLAEFDVSGGTGQGSSHDRGNDPHAQDIGIFSDTRPARAVHHGRRGTINVRA
jgi:flagellar hook-length control protein FliK